MAGVLSVCPGGSHSKHSPSHPIKFEHRLNVWLRHPKVVTREDNSVPKLLGQSQDSSYQINDFIAVVSYSTTKIIDLKLARQDVHAYKGIALFIKIFNSD